MSPPISYLLDKGVVRRISQARRRVMSNVELTQEQEDVISVYYSLRITGKIIYITVETMNILEHHAPLLAKLFAQQTTVLQKGRYLKRWARRLRNLGFTNEDAILISNASFGVDITRRTLGSEVLVTLDKAMIRNFNHHESTIVSRFNAMKHNLDAPYNQAILPELLSVRKLLSLLT